MKFEQLQMIYESKVFIIVRAKSSAQLDSVVEAVKAGGARILEVTMTTPGALEVIRESAKKYAGDMLIGAGSVLDPETARLAILAGAEFIVGPTTNRGVIELCHRYSKVVIPGAYTPTEIVTAYEYGADLVKVFPASAGGPEYIKALRGPLPQIPLVPVGGVELANASAFMKAGAAALGVGGGIVNSKIIDAGQFDLISENVRKLMVIVNAA